MFVFDDSEFFVWKNATSPFRFYHSQALSKNQEIEDEKKKKKIENVFILFLFLFNCGFYSQYYHAFIYV